MTAKNKKGTRLTKKQMLEKYGEIVKLSPTQIHKKMEKVGAWKDNCQFLKKEEKIILIQKKGKGSVAKKIYSDLQAKMDKMRPIQAKNIKRAKAGESEQVAMERAKREGRAYKKPAAKKSEEEKSTKKNSKKVKTETKAKKVKTETKAKKVKTETKAKAKAKTKKAAPSKKDDGLFDEEGGWK